MAPQVMMDIFTLPKREGGPARLDKVLAFIREAWNGEGGKGSTELRGTNEFFRRYPDVNNRALVMKLGAIPPDEIKHLGRRNHDDYKDSLPVGHARAMWHLYNLGRRTQKLDPWEEEG